MLTRPAWRVILWRGETLEPVIYDHKDRESAQRRADVLAELHCVPVRLSREYAFLIDAESYYAKK